ncbi:MAG: amidase [Pseudomonadota bacterium]
MDLSALALADAYGTGTATPAAAAEHCLARIAAQDAKLGAYQAVYAEEARRLAEAAGAALAAGGRIGPLHGVPFALKDLIDIEGRVTTWGSRLTAERVSPATGLLARRLLGAGAVLLGKTKTVECAFGGWGTNTVMGTPWNPWDLETARAPGGSSSGSGVAVAAGMASFAIGTDTGGSVRMPAAFCGIVGLKVTEGVLPCDGIMPLSHTLDTPGPMTRTVRDAALVLEVMRGTEAAAIEADLAAPDGRFAALGRGVGGLRLGVLGQAERDLVSAPILATYDEALARLEAMGADCVAFEPPTRHVDLAERNFVISSSEAFAHHGARFIEPAAPVDASVRARMLRGKDIAAAAYIQALQERPREQARWRDAMAGLDAILTPSTLCEPPPLDTIDPATAPAEFTRPYNYLGMCALALPIGLTASGLPASLQIAARAHDEWGAMRIGAALEEATPRLPAL